VTRNLRKIDAWGLNRLIGYADHGSNVGQCRRDVLPPGFDHWPRAACECSYLVVFNRHLAVTVRLGRSVREVPLTGTVSETGNDPALAGVIVAVINVAVGFPIIAIVPSVGAIATVA